MNYRFAAGKLLLSTLLILMVILISPALKAQSGISNPRSVAMGGAYTAVARGVEAPGWNPANLGLSGKDVYRLNLISIGLGIHNNSFSKHQYDLYNGSYLTPNDKQDILASIPTQGLRADFDTEVQALGLSFGSFAFTAAGLGASDFTLSKDIVDLLLNGNELNRVYNVEATEGEGWGMSSFGISAGFPITIPAFKEFSVGASIRYLVGFGYGKVMEANSNLTTDIDGIHGSGRVVIDYARGGNGIGIDIGAAAILLNQQWSVSFGIRNILNYINWNSETKRFIYTFTADSLTAENIAESDIDSLFIDSDETINTNPFSKSLPPELRIGIARSTNRVTLAVDFVQGLRRAAGASTTPEIAFGTELRLVHFFPLRTGFSLGGKRGFSSSVGFALDFSIFSLDFAISSKGGLFSGRGLGVAFGWMFRL